MGVSIEPIGIVHSPFGQKFGIPRQAGLAPSAEGRLELLPPWNSMDALDGLEGFSHLWLLFAFHANGAPARARVRPPRLGGQRRIGVFASRSPFRPNGLGLSAVVLRAIGPGPILHLGGVDVLDGTPVYDIKPYVPYADCLVEAQAGYATRPETPLSVRFDPEVERQLAEHEHGTSLRTLALEVLATDPRPAHERRQRDHSLRLYHCDLHWRVVDHCAVVFAIERR